MPFLWPWWKQIEQKSKRCLELKQRTYRMIILPQTFDQLNQMTKLRSKDDNIYNASLIRSSKFFAVCIDT